ATFVNPAGIGFYKTGEAVLTPGFFFNNNNASFREMSTSQKRTGFDLGPTGWIIGFGSKSKPAQSSAMSIAINQTASFNNEIHYKGLNNYSSFSEAFVEQFSKSGYTIDQVLISNSPLPF